MGFDEAVLAVVDTAAGASAPPAPLLLSVDQAADSLGIGMTLMRALVSSGEIESVKIGRLRRVPADALSTYVARLRERTARLRSRAS
jgi:excisionase family DNA binding protein